MAGLREAWDREYGEVRAYTTSYRGDVDRGVHFLLQYVAGRGEIIDGPIVDCGCGMGRNAIPLARAGHCVVGLEHSGVALQRLTESLDGEMLDGELTTRQHDLNEPLPVQDDFAAAVLDITAVDNLIDAERRRAYGLEVARIMRPGGLAVVVTFARDDGYYGRWLGDSADGVVEDSNTGISNQLFTPALLDEAFVPPLTREVAATLVFLDEAAQTVWTRRFLIHVYRKDRTS
ncbi:MAG: methyltransferase domain-containing protein [Acidobacteriota bacterium]